ncbi:LutC/YkgG family protein [Solitalea lacus]|uniref:LutC/YkgG family protein n=1 Tax=Solitalea lacus TaxID=2911172 RepID=UPI001EDB36EA|nr:LUD domain-containing protein [Solitalea lacus]UKJ08184.1 LUD domain-containing protein [Solitalea lacus]
MSARDKIKNAIIQNKPSAVELPKIPLFLEEEQNAIETFSRMVELVGGSVIELSTLSEINEFVQSRFSDTHKIASSIVYSTIDVNEDCPHYLLEKIDLAILEGVIGVAENGAVWLPEKNMLHRALPFITQHLLLVLKKENIVANMHYAYEKVAEINYGVFISGPSKTADIEQSLVIGAHGARSLTVILTN